jgi:hypothetical protein
VVVLVPVVGQVVQALAPVFDFLERHFFQRELKVMLSHMVMKLRASSTRVLDFGLRMMVAASIFGRAEGV